MADTTETPEQPQTLKVFTCFDPLHPMRSCYALVEDAPEPRMKHREWHADRHAKDEGQRKAIKARDDEIARLHERIGEYQRAAEGFEQEVRRVETPAAAVPLVIDRSGYAPDEVAGDPDDDDEDDWGLPLAAPASADPAEPENEPADEVSDADRLERYRADVQFATGERQGNPADETWPTGSR